MAGRSSFRGWSEGLAKMLRLSRKPQALQAVIDEPRYVASLWRQLKAHDDDAAREALFAHYQDFALQISRREYGRRPSYGFEREDFDQLAFSGLLQAIDRFDPLSRCSFKTLARYRIAGSIADGVLKSSEKASVYSAAKRLERDRTASFIRDGAAGDAGHSVEALRDLVANLAISGLVESVTRDVIENVEDQTEPGAYESLRFNQMQRLLMEAMGDMPGKQKQVVDRHYFEDMPFTLIAQIMRLTKGRISLLHSAAIAFLRHRLRSR
mgnify:CR=1 FL=1